MNKLNTILVGVDFSDCSRCALEQAVRLARWNSARLHVIHAVESLVITEAAEALQLSIEKMQADTVRQAGDRLRTWIDEVGAPAETSVSVSVGPPIEILLSTLRSAWADLLVLGASGDSALPFGAGTLATKCLRKAPTKVMLVKEGHSHPFRTVVACVDFSEMSREAVVQTLRVGAQDQSEVHVLHVFEGPWRRLRYRAETPAANPDFERQYRTLLEHRLREFVGNTAGRKTLFTVFDASSHGHGIAEYVRRVQADLVVLGNKGSTNLRYVLLGSTVERLLRELPCSVLVVRPPAGDPADAESKGRS
jgi:universal stress protein E